MRTVANGPAPEAIARTVVGLAIDGCFAELAEMFAPTLRTQVSAETVHLAWTAELGKAGPVTFVGEPVAEPGDAGLVRVRVPVTCERGGLTVVMSIDDAGRLNGLRLAPADGPEWTPPAYAAPERFSEHDVTVGAGPSAVLGTMSVPSGDGPWPGVVLLSGMGPFDRDETSGPNKPLKDLAWGLATRGIVVVRFDKPTWAHARRVAETPGFTMADEYVPYARACLRLLQEHPGVDAGRLFAAGHSMGGRAALRVAVAAEPPVAGLVLLAADAQPLHEAAVRAVRYLAALYPGPDLEAAAEALARQAALAGGPDLSGATPAARLPFGYSGSYWLDLRGFDPVATAAALDTPLLVLQGGRDYQVTVEDDLARWRAGLPGRPGVTIRVHDADDHLFFPGTGPSTPADYARPQHVDPAVIDDITAWLASAPPHIG